MTRGTGARGARARDDVRVTPEKVIAALLVRRAAQLLRDRRRRALVVAIVLLGVVRGVGLALLAGGAAMAMSARSRL